MIFGISVAAGEIPLMIIDEKAPQMDFGMSVFAAILIGITFLLCRWRLKREIKKNLYHE